MRSDVVDGDWEPSHGLTGDDILDHRFHSPSHRPESESRRPGRNRPDITVPLKRAAISACSR